MLLRDNKTKQALTILSSPLQLQLNQPEIMKISTTTAVSAFAALAAAPSVSAASLRNLRWGGTATGPTDAGPQGGGGGGGGGGGSNGMYPGYSNLYFTHSKKMCDEYMLSFCYNLTAAAIANTTTCELPMALCELDGVDSDSFSCHADKDVPQDVLDEFAAEVTQYYHTEPEHGEGNYTGNGCCMTLDDNIERYCKDINSAAKCNVAEEDEINLCTGYNTTANPPTVFTTNTAPDCNSPVADTCLA